MQEAKPTLEKQPTPKPRDSRAFSALRQGPTGQVHILTPADQTAYDKHCRGYVESLAPVGAYETDLVHSIADDRWRLKRAAAIENCIFAEGMSRPAEIVSGHPEVDAALAQAAVWVEKSGSLQLLALYESRIQHRFERNMAELRQLQSCRKAALQQAVEQAALILDLAESKGETYNIETDFPVETLPAVFAISTGQIARLAALQRCLVAAKKLHAAPKGIHRMMA